MVYIGLSTHVLFDVIYATIDTLNYPCIIIRKMKVPQKNTISALKNDYLMQSTTGYVWTQFLDE